MLKKKNIVKILILNLFFVSQLIFGINNTYASKTDNNGHHKGWPTNSDPSVIILDPPTDPTTTMTTTTVTDPTATTTTTPTIVDVIKDYGAKGDGVTDDTIAFKSAIATGLPVYVPPGTFLVSDTLQLQNSIKFDGQIKMTNYKKTCLEVKNKVVEMVIENPNIDGGWGAPGCPINFGEPNYYYGDRGHAISILSSANVTIHGGNLQNTGGDGIFVSIDTNVPTNAWNYSPNNISVDGTVIDNVNHTIIGIEAGANCTFRNITGFKHNNFVAGINIEPNSAKPNATINNLLFDNCYIVSDGSIASDDPILLYGLDISGKAEPFQVDCVSVNVPHSWGSITVKNSTFIANNCFAARCLGESNLNYFTDVLMHIPADPDGHSGNIRT